MDDATRIEIAKQYLRRTFATNLTGLKQLATQIAATAFEAVTITGQGFEGGNAQGQVLFEPIAYLAAVEDIIAELDPNAVLPPSRVAYADFRWNRLAT